MKTCMFFKVNFNKQNCLKDGSQTRQNWSMMNVRECNELGEDTRLTCMYLIKNMKVIINITSHKFSYY